jgi:hypothetical protein
MANNNLGFALKSSEVERFKEVQKLRQGNPKFEIDPCLKGKSILAWGIAL